MRHRARSQIDARQSRTRCGESEVIGTEPLDQVRMWQALRDEVKAGHQAYVVCPLVEDKGSVEAKAATVELPRGVRINCISPTVLTESVTYHPFFPGFIPVGAREVGQAYVRAISNPFTGRIFKLYKTDS